jgi:DNA-binding PadR family transcriptional regulator
MRRKAGKLIPIEISILEAGIDLQSRGVPEFHGFFIAKEIAQREDRRRLTAYGTLYKALDRMEKAGQLVNRWEDPMIAAEEGRPRRRLYQVTVIGERALADARAIKPAPGMKAEAGLADR